MMKLPWSESSDSGAYTCRLAGRGYGVSLRAAAYLSLLCLSDKVFCDTEGPSEPMLAETLICFSGMSGVLTRL